MSKVLRIAVVVVVGAWMLWTLVPHVECVWSACPSIGLTLNYDGVVAGVDDGSPAAKASIQPGDRVAFPIPRDLYREPPPPATTFGLARNGVTRTVTLVPQPQRFELDERLRLLALSASYLLFLVVGSAVLLLRPSAMTWMFYLFCVVRRFGDLGLYLPGPSDWYWANYFVLLTTGGAGCPLVAMFALRFPHDRMDGWRKPVNAVAAALAVALPVTWFSLFWRLIGLGLPVGNAVERLAFFTSILYLGAAAIFLVTLARSHGDERQRIRWILVFPITIVMRAIAIDLPHALPEWYSGLLTALGALVPLTVAYAIVRQRVFDIEFAISRAVIYGVITSIVAGTFLLLDWLISAQFSQSRLTLTAEIVVALALGSWLNMLHKNVDRFVDGTFFRQRHRSEKRLSRAAAAVLRAETHDAVDRFLVHEPVEALGLISAALFHRDGEEPCFVREQAVGWSDGDVSELTGDDPLVLHLLAGGEPVRLADVAWSSDRLPPVKHAVLATPVMLRDELVTIVLYGPHRSGADIDPDEVRSLVRLTQSAGASYDHIDARTLREELATLLQQCEMKDRELAALRTKTGSIDAKTTEGLVPGAS
ncbi:MAG TPA: hypothetical protein VFE36_09735 [Candidatus Baltobacteraceae bacterium]|nr:hypothetical protein [Candidatus Baltobacteraceae bacterium]